MIKNDQGQTGEQESHQINLSYGSRLFRIIFHIKILEKNTPCRY